MAWWRSWKHREELLNDELRFHIDALTEGNLRAGMIGW